MDRKLSIETEYRWSLWALIILNISEVSPPWWYAPPFGDSRATVGVKDTRASYNSYEQRGAKDTNVDFKKMQAKMH